ncbi:hypothetical protein S83_036103 [Arachis hypogaea]
MPNAGDDDHKVQFALQAESCDANSSSVDDTILRDKCWWSMMACLNIREDKWRRECSSTKSIS